METKITTTLTPDELESLVYKAVRAGIEELPRHPPKEKADDKPLNVDEVCELTDLARPTIYRLVQSQDIPHFRRAKRLYFNREEILHWLHGRHKKSLSSN